MLNVENDKAMKINVFAVVFTLSLTAAVHAQQPERLSLQQCVDIAMGGNAGVKAAEKSVERAKALQGTAWDLDKTSLSLSQDPTSGGSPDNAVSVTQEMEFPTLYVARRRQLKAETSAERSRADMVRAQLGADVASLYWQMVYQGEMIKILQRHDNMLARYESVATKRYEAGETRQVESLSARRMRMENSQELSSARSELAALQRQMVALLGTDRVMLPAEDSLVMLSGNGISYNFSQTAEGRYANDRIAVADRAVGVAKNGYAPTLSLSLRNQLVLSSWNPYDTDRSKFSGGNFMGFEVGVGVPIFYGATKARVKAAKKEREIAELEMRQTELQRNQEYAAGLARLETARQKAEFYLGKGADNMSEMMRIGSVEYENGEISYIEYMDIMQNAIDADIRRADAVNGYNQAVVSLRRLTGGM